MSTDAVKGHRLGAAFIKPISQQVMESAAVRHPYLRAIRDGDFPDVELAFRDFAFQYGLYSANFTRYVRAVIHNVEDPAHKEILHGNLAEEEGHVHDIELPVDVLTSVVGQPHSELYRRFQEALGIDVGSRDSTPHCPGLVWSQQFLQLCEESECVGVGALGIGTELIVAHIYNQILDGLKAHSELTPTQRVFFDLHSECDEKHAAEMVSISEDLAQDADACAQIEYGVNRAIALRTAFWDRMLERAQDPTTAGFPGTDRQSADGH